jgi:hypothetical protein
VSPGGHWQGRPEVGRIMGHYYMLSSCRSTLPGPPPKNSMGTPPMMPPAPRRPNFNRPRAAMGKRRRALPSRVLRRVPRLARRGANSTTKRPQLMAMAASTSEHAALARSMPQRPWAAASARRDQTMPTHQAQGPYLEAWKSMRPRRG